MEYVLNLKYANRPQYIRRKVSSAVLLKSLAVMIVPDQSDSNHILINCIVIVVSFIFTLRTFVCSYCYRVTTYWRLSLLVCLWTL